MNKSTISIVRIAQVFLILSSFSFSTWLIVRVNQEAGQRREIETVRLADGTACTVINKSRIECFPAEPAPAVYPTIVK